MKSKKFNLPTKLLAVTVAGLSLAGIISACGDDDDDATDDTRAQITTTVTTARATTTTRPLAIG